LGELSRGNLQIPMQDYKSLRVAAEICSSLVNLHTHTVSWESQRAPRSLTLRQCTNVPSRPLGEHWPTHINGEQLKIVIWHLSLVTLITVKKDTILSVKQRTKARPLYVF